MRLYLQPASLESSRYLVRIVFLRALAFVYGVAFTVAYKQNKALIGDAGLTPARHVLDQAEARANNKQKQRQAWIAGRNMTGPSEDQNRYLPVVETISLRLYQNRFFQRLRHLWDYSDSSNRPVTTILWLVKDRSKLNSWLDRIAVCGIGMAAVVFLLGAANLPLLLALWVCQRSLWAVGGPWYGYGWEPQLAELGFHSLFLVPLWSLKPFAAPAVPSVVAWSMRWFLFRIMIGAGLIKLKGGKEWKDLTAMYHHYETQPIPNPLSKYFHNAPKWWHRWEVITNHFVELVAPWMLLLPFRRLRIIGGLIQIIFQAVLILSGNLSFLNWLTAVPAIFCLDDAVLMPLFSSSRVATAEIASWIDSSVYPVSTTRRAVNVLYGLVVSTLSVPVVRNLCSRRQVMNGSFDPLRLVNTYGAFGTVGSERTELVVSSALDAAGEWKEYEFPAKPSDVNKPPRWISPYHYRLDWQMWIAVQLGSVNRSPWMFTLLKKLFEGDEGVLTSLLGKILGMGKDRSIFGLIGIVTDFIILKKDRMVLTGNESTSDVGTLAKEYVHWKVCRATKYFLIRDASG
ncbi:Lipase maturation factor [Fragilaria crotonensis]|nr:Lipase maturation factor [Fragilaria crotonensis]